jgi:tetratricopeptide (TPR) repeat protein
MKDDPEPSADAPPDTHGESVHAVEPMASLDHELFIEGELPGGEESSLLRQIPVEEIALNEEAPEVESEAFMEFSEVEPLAALVEEPEPLAPTAPPLPPVPEVPVVPVTPPMPVMPVMPVMKETRPPASEAHREREEAPPEPGRGPAITEEPSRDQAPATHEDEMRRMRQGGGEARLLRDVKLHFKLQDWEGAVPLLEQLLRISPGSALYRGMLARALSRHPVRRKDAEEHFIEALRLSPQDAELHYWLGLYYKSFGLKARAVTEFRTALRLDPKHEGARKQLSGDRKDDAVGAVIKKIFG